MSANRAPLVMIPVAGGTFDFLPSPDLDAIINHKGPSRRWAQVGLRGNPPRKRGRQIAPIDILAAQDAVKDVVLALPIFIAPLEKMAQFAAKRMDTGNFEQRPDKQGNQNCWERLGVLPSGLSKHPREKIDQGVTFDTFTQLAVGEDKRLRERIRNRCISSTSDFLRRFAACPTVVCFLIFHTSNLGQAA